MPVNLVRDANISAIAIVGKGANRKRFFLRKADRGRPHPLPSVERLLKADSWSAVYVVVAEPDWHESPGSAPGTDQSIEDRWASEDEIRKAAHRFMANGGLVTKMHESLEPYGQLVENAVALVDFTIDGEVIRKGSWYIAIEPSAEGKVAIERGEFTGVSIEGLATRELVEKHSFSSTDNTHTTEVQPMNSTTTARLDSMEKAVEQAGDAIAAMLVKALGLSNAKRTADAPAAADEDAEDRLARKIAKEMAAARPTFIAREFEREGIDPSLMGVLEPSNLASADADARFEGLIAKAEATPSIEALRKACEAEGINPALAGVFGGA